MEELRRSAEGRYDLYSRGGGVHSGSPHFRGVAVALAALLLPLASARAARGAEVAGASQVDHRVRVALLPAEHRLVVEDEMRLPAGRAEVRFALHAGLEPEVATPGVSLEALPARSTAELLGPGLGGPDAPPFPPRVPEVTLYELRSASGSLPPTVTLRYGGVIHHPLEAAGEEYDRSFRETAGTIQENGVFLAGSTFWLAWLGPELVSFVLDVDLPEGWDAVSEGRRAEHVADAHGTRVRWVQETPVEDAHLVAAPFTVYERPADAVATYAYLREADEGLAGRYLETGARYLAMYDRLIGPYPYPKLALVENFWETGYGMPSFTLLGPTVLRFPFILTSSWPHEILHNWWGNGVFPPAVGGNWSEGLTAYLADHLSKEQAGEGAEYRRDLLQKYADYVRAGNDFPLAEFRSRHSGATAAVGYGKTAMVFHMLRRRLGDAAFAEGLRNFYRDHLDRRASFDDLRRAFEAAGGVSLAGYFDAWVEHPGAPKLELTSAAAERTGSGWQVEVGIAQSQAGTLFPLRVPVAVTVEGEATARLFEIDLDGARAEGTFAVADRPLRLAVDPVVAVARAADDPARALGFVAADRAAAVPGLARKLPHYGKYGYLAFAGDEPQNVAKGSWRPVGSPLERILAQGMEPPPPAAPLPERPPLAELPPAPSSE